MYAQNRPTDSQNQESGGAQSFRRGSYHIPASYRGNAFLVDEVPSPTEEEVLPLLEASAEAVRDKSESCPPAPSAEKPHPGLLSKLDHLELDDLLLIGLVLLLSRGRENSMETLILLAILFFTLD